METKRNNWTLGDTLSKLHPGGKISRDPSPKPGSTAQSERERQRIPEDEWRREREMEKMRDRIRYKEKDVYLQERCDERDTVSAPRARPDEREWRERKKRREEDRSKSGGLLSNVDRETERVMKKGDTFPRIAKHVADCGRRTAEIVKDRIGNRQMDRGERKEKRERERAWQRERYRETEDLRLRATEEGRLRGEEKAQREKYRDYDVSFQERRRGRHLEVADIRDIRERERDAHSTQEKDRSYMRAKGRRTPSPYQRRDQETCLQTKDRKKEGRRDTKSEGDSDETESRKDRLRDREELIYQHSRSEGDNKGKPAREKHHERQGYREEDRVRQTGQEWHSRNDRKLEKEFNREAERWKENASDRKRFTQDDRTRTNDRRQDDRYREREYEERRARERKEREVDPVRRREMSAKVAPQSHSSGEWSSDMDSDARYRRGRDTNEEGIGEIDAEETGSQEGIAKGRERELKESRRRDRDGAERTGGAQERRRMWLEPQRGNKSKESHLEEERERHLRQEERRNEQEREVESQMEHGVKEEKDERCWDQRDARGRHTDDREHRRNMEHMEKRGAEEREIEGISLDKEEVGEVWGEGDKGGGKVHLSNSDGSNEGSRLNEVESENMTDDMEESDTEERGGSDYYAHSESEGGSERGWVQDWDKRLSAEDEFVTVSSGGEREEEEFQDCREFWEGGIPPVDFERYGQEKEREDEWRVGEEMVDENGEVQENEKQPKYVYCVIGQTWPPTKRREASGSHQTCREERECLNVESHDHDSDDIIQHTEDDQHPRLGRNDDYMISNRDREVTSERNENNMPDEDTLNKDTDETTDVDVGCRASTESMGKKVEHLHAEMNTVKRDSQTEKLLMEWREKNKEQTEREKEQASQIPAIHSAGIDAQGTFQQTTLAGINTGSISLEEEEASRIHVSRTWSMSEETKRRSQAPHLKWAKTVVRQILGTSDEQSIDDPNSGSEQGDSRCELTMENDKQGVDVAQETGEVFSCAKVEELRTDEPQSEAELEEEEPLELEGLRGTGQSKTNIHTEQFTAVQSDTYTYTHAETLLDTEQKEDHHPATDTNTQVEVTVTEEAGDEVSVTELDNKAKSGKEMEMYLSVSNTLYKPNSCPILNYESEPDLWTSYVASVEQEVEDRSGENEEERQIQQSQDVGAAEEVCDESLGEGNVGEEMVESVAGGILASSSFRDLGPDARLRRRGIRKTTERRNEDLVEVEEEGVGRDRRPRIFSITDDEDSKSDSWGEVDLRNVLDTIGRRKRNSKFFNFAQLYQQYSETVQNIEILQQSRSCAVSVNENTAQLPSTSPSSSPSPSPRPACRPLPPLPDVPHPHSLSKTVSVTSVKSLPLPEPPRTEGRAHSPRLSISLTQSATLWRELPGVRNSEEIDMLTEDQRRLQEVRFEVVTSEASYCRSLDIVVEHFVKSKQLGALLSTQDRNWLFSRLADVRAISHSFLSKLEEQVESDILHFSVCDIIARHCQRFRMVYVPYLTNQSYQDATYQRLMNENPAFKRIVEKLERSPLCQRLPLRSFLVLPFQRITRIKLLVQNIVKRTTPGTTEAAQAIKSLKLLEKLIQESNNSITQMKSIESLVSLSAKVDFECRTLPLISQARRLVREGPVTELMDFSLKDTERNIYLHLFNDYLLLSQQKEGGRFTVIDHCPVSDLRAENCRVKLYSLQENLFRLHMTNKALLLRTDTQSDKLRWISALSRPHPEIDFSAAQDFPQMQCIKAFVGQQPDELTLDKADIILVHQQSSDHWVEGTRLSDRHRGWVPESHLETITNPRVLQRNLSDAQKIKTATAAV
ncbi:trichohyalin isoform X1 [Thalassophryne amazonica]|uniref:trichohyalin isoform X1 n=1 Tax=Thalassophryne amazonica TaxID=390379 RepID=UPI0014709133|nr:trichohyalin isoform X1 [Thalassophryne amazonica]